MLAARNRNSRYATIGESVIGGGVMAVDLNNGQPEDTGPDSYENLLDDYSHFAPPAADEVLQGTVLSVTAKDVIVDFGYKSEGLVPIEQFRNPDGNVTVQRGLYARIPSRSASGPQPGFAGWAGHPRQNHQTQPPPRQCGGFSQDRRGRREQRAQDRS